MIVVTAGEEVWFAEQFMPHIRGLGRPQRRHPPLMAPRGALPMRLTS